jgi:hypothetical protein
MIGQCDISLNELVNKMIGQCDISLNELVKKMIGQCDISLNELVKQIILQSVHVLYKYAMRINFCFIRTRRINFSYYTNKLFSLRINFPGTL